MSSPRPPLSQKIIYAFGQLGWSLAAFGAANLLVYFYMPPENAESSIFPSYIFQGAILGVLTIIGIVNFGGRIFDAITDPLIANWSDKSMAKMGKRKHSMAIAAVPFALLSFLIFYPPFEDPTLNSFCLLGMIFLFYLFMTLYVVPYTALISELGHHPEDRLLISTLISVAWALGFLIGNSAYALQSVFEKSMVSTEAFQATIALYAVVALVFMLVPVLFLNENKYCVQGQSETKVLDAVKRVFSNKNFLYFSISDLMYWLALTFIQLGVSFYITVLMGLEIGMASAFMGIGFLASFLLYVPINILAKKIGKKRVLILAFIAFSTVFGLTFLMDKLPIPTMVLFYFLAILSAFPLASFGIIPNAIIADIVHEHEARTGESQAGMFYAARNFMMKLGISLANLIFPSLLLLGKSVEEPTGVRVSALCAFLFCLVGYFFFTKFQDLETIA